MLQCSYISRWKGKIIMKYLTILKNTIKIGIERPFRFLQITDTHLAIDDERISNRWKCFESPDNRGQIEDYFLQALKYAKNNNLFVVHTGDLLDFLSESNYKFVDEHFSDVDYIYAAGNHDFCHFVGEATEDQAYKWEMIKRSAPHFKSNLYFDSRVINGVNFVTLDNSYYLMTDGQIDLLKAEAAKGYPIILCMHVPLYDPTMPKGSSQVAYVVGAPENLLATYPESRRLQQTPDEATVRAIEYIKNETLIKALVTGHTHKNHEGVLDNGVTQYMTDGSFAGYVREFTVI